MQTWRGRRNKVQVLILNSERMIITQWCPFWQGKKYRLLSCLSSAKIYKYREYIQICSMHIIIGWAECWLLPSTCTTISCTNNPSHFDKVISEACIGYLSRPKPAPLHWIQPHPARCSVTNRFNYCLFHQHPVLVGREDANSPQA